MSIFVLIALIVACLFFFVALVASLIDCDTGKVLATIFILFALMTVALFFQSISISRGF